MPKIPNDNPELPIFQQLDLLETCPIEFPFKVGDVVKYTNEYGLNFHVQICGFSSDDVMFGKYEKCVHFCGIGNELNGYAWWMPHLISDFSALG
jgi:hypothetical protein